MSGGGWQFLKNTTDSSSSPPPLFQPDGLNSNNSSAGDDNTHAGAGGALLGSCYGICDGIMSNDPAANPDFHAYNKVPGLLEVFGTESLAYSIVH